MDATQKELKAGRAESGGCRNPEADATQKELKEGVQTAGTNTWKLLGCNSERIESVLLARGRPPAVGFEDATQKELKAAKALHL